MQRARGDNGPRFRLGSGQPAMHYYDAASKGQRKSRPHPRVDTALPAVTEKKLHPIQQRALAKKIAGRKPAKPSPNARTARASPAPTTSPAERAPARLARAAKEKREREKRADVLVYGDSLAAGWAPGRKAPAPWVGNRRGTYYLDAVDERQRLF